MPRPLKDHLAQAVRDICCQLAESAEAIFDHQNFDTDLEQHDVVADAQSVATSGRILLVDGFTVTAADTPENQEVFPQNPSQKEGLGFPLIRGVSLISMVTGLLVDLMLGPYAGKQSGETALMWQILDRLQTGRRHAGCGLLLLQLLDRSSLQKQRRQHRDEKPSQTR